MHDLIAILTSRGAALVGFADMGAVPSELRAGLPRAVSIAAALDPAVVAGIANGPTREYVANYSTRNALLDELAAEAERLLRARGARAERFAATNLGTAVRLPHKTAATRAGLGWIGKCALLVTERYGPAVRLATVLTDAELPVGAPVDESRCGECQECRKVCPGGAIRGPNWRLGMEREEIFSEPACREGIRKVGAGLERLVCGMCIAACPWTGGYLRRASGPSQPQMNTDAHG